MNIRFSQVAIASAVCALIPAASFLAGCGGGVKGSGLPSSGTTATSRSAGSASIKIKWPARTAANSRVVPELSNQVVVDVYRRINGVETKIATGQASRATDGTDTETINLVNLPIDQLTVVATAYQNADPKNPGLLLAIGSVNITTVAGQTVGFGVSMGSIIDHIDIAPSFAAVPSGGIETFVVTAYDGSNEKTANVIPLPPDKIQWASSNTKVATINNGVMSALVLGTTNITVTDTESTKSASAYVLVTPPVNTAGNANYHVVATPTVSFTGLLDLQFSAPSAKVANWVGEMPQAPTTDSQANVNSTITLPAFTTSVQTIYNEYTSEARPILEIQATVGTPASPSNLVVDTTYSAQMYSRVLAAGTFGVAPTLSSTDQTNYLAYSTSIDYYDQTVQDWLTNNVLMRKATETEYDFGLRMAQWLAANVSYFYSANQDRTVGSLVQSAPIYTDSFGASYIYTAIMRANGIPARVLVGRTAVQGTYVGPAEVAAQQARVELWANGVGWIPVEIGNIIQNHTAAGYFAVDDGKFFTVHIDPDLYVDSVFFGIQYLDTLDKTAVWAQGSGNVYNGQTRGYTWTVTTH